MLIPCLRNSFVGLAASRRYRRLRYNIFRHIAEQGRHFAREHADRPDQSPLPPSASINQHAGSRQSSLPQSILYVSQEWRTPQSPRDLESTCCLDAAAIPHAGEAPYRGRLRRTPQATRSTVARNQPSPIPKPRQNTLPQASHHRFQTAPKRAPATPALATNSPSASSPKPPPQTSKQSRARVRNIV